MCFKIRTKNEMEHSAGVNQTAELKRSNVHLFFLIRKLPPVLQGVVVATVIFDKCHKGGGSITFLLSLPPPPPPSPPPKRNPKVASLFLSQCAVMNATPLCLTVNAPHL